MMQRLLLAAGASLAAIALQGAVLAADSGDRAAVVATYTDIALAICTPIP
jgi:hypothetical protein